MANNVWYPRYVGDYQRKTSHLSLMENGAYSMLLDHYYATSKPLPANAEQLHRICRALTEQEQAAVSVVVAQFFYLKDGAYHNAKADEELIRRGEISEKRKNAATLGRAKHGAKAEHLHQQMPEQMPAQMLTQPQPQYSDPNGSAADAAVETVKPPDDEPDLKTRIFGPLREWLMKQSGRTDAQCRTMLGRWIAKHGEAQTIEAVTQAARNAPLDPIPYVERIFSNGKSTKPTARGSATAHAAGLAAALGVGRMVAGNAAPDIVDRPAIGHGDQPIGGPSDAGINAGLRPSDAAIDRIRGGVRDTVPRPGDGAIDLSGNPVRFAGGPTGDGGIAHQNPLDVGQSNAVSGRSSGNRGGRFQPPKSAVKSRQNGVEATVTTTQGQRDFGLLLGRTETANSAHRAEQQDHKTVADLSADHKSEKTGQGRASDSDGPSPYQTGATCEPAGRIFNPGGIEIRLEVAS